MKPRIKTISGRYGTYLKADRTTKTDYPICVQFEDGRKGWLRTWEISQVELKANVLTSEKFCKLLLIPFKSHLTAEPQ